MAFDTSIFHRYQSNIESPTNALMRGLEVQRAQQGNALQSMQMQALIQKQRDEQQQRAQQQAFMQGIPSPQMASAQNALAAQPNPMAGPTRAAGAMQAPVDPRLQMMHGAMRAGLLSPMDYISASAPQRKLMKLGAGDTLVDEGNPTKPLFTAPAKASEAPSAIKEYEYAKGQGYQGTFDQWDTARKRAGATSVSVNTGQKGLDNTLKLRGDFRSEPVYKAHQEMQAAYSQIQQSLKQKTPAGDLAGATKIMKLLDPGSVVRESELGMAMAASGLLDRVTSYAGRIITGEKLTPQQRTDFQALADALYGESVKQYNGKRGEYQGIAERNGLPVADVLGSESAAPKPVIKPGATLKFDANGNMVSQ